MDSFLIHKTTSMEFVEIPEILKTPLTPNQSKINCNISIDSTDSIKSSDYIKLIDYRLQ